MATAEPSAGVMAPLASALELARLGFAVFPVLPRSKYPAVALAAATAEPAEVAALFDARPSANIGIAVGPLQRLLVFDIDHSQGGARSLHALERLLGPLPATVRARTHDGEHLFFRWQGPYQRLELLPGCAIVGPAVSLPKALAARWGRESGWVVAPPSEHPHGGCYAWSPGASPHERPLAELPDTWVRLIAQTAPRTRGATWLADHSAAPQRVLSHLGRLLPRQLRQRVRLALLLRLARRAT